MLLCIFCRNELDPTTRPEHILLDCLGGRKTTRRAICSCCNNVFGSTIDATLSSQIAEIRNMLQLRSGTGANPPALRNVQAGNERFEFRPDGTPGLIGKPFVLYKKHDGTFDLQVRVNSSEQLQRLIPHIAAKIGCTESALRNQLEKSQIQSIYRCPGPAQRNLGFGGPEAIRSIVKSFLVLWSTVVGNREVQSDAYAEAREFVQGRSKTFPINRATIDGRRLPCASAIEARFGPLFNLIYVASNSTGRVVGHFTLYNMIAWRIVLAQHGGMANHSGELVSNPLDPSQWSGNGAGQIVLDFDWLNGPIDDGSALSSLPDRFTAVMQEYSRIAMRRETAKIVDETCLQRGIAPDGAISARRSRRSLPE